MGFLFSANLWFQWFNLAALLSIAEREASGLCGMAAAQPIGNSRNTDVTAKGAAVKVVYEGTWSVSVSFTVHVFTFEQLRLHIPNYKNLLFS